MKLQNIAGAAAFFFSAVLTTPVVAQEQGTTPVPPCTEGMFVQVIDAMTPQAVEEQLAGIYVARQADTWQGSARVFSNHVLRFVSDQGACSAENVNFDISPEIIARANVANKPLPQRPGDAVEEVEARAAVEAAEAAEAAMPGVEADIEESGSHLATLERARAREPNNRLLHRQISGLRREVTALKRRQTSLRNDMARRDWVEQNFVSQAEFRSILDPASDSYLGNDAEFISALRAALTNPDLGNNALSTVGRTRSMINEAMTEAPPPETFSAAWFWSWFKWVLKWIFLPLGVIVGVIGFIRSLRPMPDGLTQSDVEDIRKAVERSTSAKKKAEELEKSIGTKASGKDVALLENRVASIESRYNHKVEKIAQGDQKTLLPADINKLEKGDTFTYHLMVDGEPESFEAEVVDKADSGNAVVKVDGYEKPIVSKKLFGTLAGYIDKRKVD